MENMRWSCDFSLNSTIPKCNWKIIFFGGVLGFIKHKNFFTRFVNFVHFWHKKKIVSNIELKINFLNFLVSKLEINIFDL